MDVREEEKKTHKQTTQTCSHALKPRRRIPASRPRPSARRRHFEFQNHRPLPAARSPRGRGGERGVEEMAAA